MKSHKITHHFLLNPIISPFFIDLFSNGGTAELRTGGGPSRGRGRWRHRLDPSDARRMVPFRWSPVYHLYQLSI